MTRPFDERDLIQLNAYLDGELSTGERAAFERRLAQDADLRAELAEIRATVALLGMAGRVRVPRSFTLDPAVYGRPQRPALWDWLGLRQPSVALASGVALVATLVCVGALAIYGLGARGAAFDVAMQPAAEPEMMLQAGEAAEPDAADAFPAEEPAPDMVGAAAAEDASEPTAEAMFAPGEAPAAEEAPVEAPAPAVEAPAPLPAPEGTAPSVPAEAERAAVSPTEQAPAGEAAPEEPAPLGAETAARPLPLSLWLAVAVVAAAVAVLAGGLALALGAARRSRRG